MAVLVNLSSLESCGGVAVGSYNPQNSTSKFWVSLLRNKRYLLTPIRIFHRSIIIQKTPGFWSIRYYDLFPQLWNIYKYIKPNSQYFHSWNLVWSYIKGMYCCSYDVQSFLTGSQTSNLINRAPLATTFTRSCTFWEFL